MPTRPVTDEQRADAARLQRLFNAWRLKQVGPNGKPPSMDAIAATAGMKQSAFSQWLNGKMALNADSAVEFAQLIGCSVAEFSPSLAAYIDRLAERSVKRKAKRGDPNWAAQFNEAQMDLVNTISRYGAILSDDQCRALVAMIRASINGKAAVTA